MVQNNMIHITSEGPGISIFTPTAPLRTDTYPGNWVVEEFAVRFNTAVHLVGSAEAIALDDGTTDHPYTYTVAGNLAVRIGSGTIFKKPAATALNHDVETRSLDDFVSAIPTYDFHLEPGAAACILATGVTPFPATDIDGDPRPGSKGVLAAGADQCP